jgi:ligand-binding SRPBCC domain-containing protein
VAVGIVEREQLVRVPLEDAFAFYADPHNLERITPRWLRFRIVEAPAELREGSLLRYRLRLFGVRIDWLTRIAVWEPPRRFVDVQLHGPYRLWEHTHELVPRGRGTLIRDRVVYRVPPLPLARPLVARWLRGIFDHRAQATAAILGTPGTGY